MINIRLQTSLLLAILIFLISCNKHYNSQKLQTINQLEKVIESDVSHLNSLNMHNIHSVLKIASFNLSKIEEGKMDSIEFEIIYNDYKAYINCINLIYENLLKIDQLHSMVEKNKNQLHFDNNFFSCFGAFEIIKNGWETEAIPETNSKNGEKLGFFARIFGNV